MPNWCENRITISASKELMPEIRVKLFTDEGKLTFDLLIPMPAILKRTTSGSMSCDGTIHKSWTWDDLPDGKKKERPFTDAEKAEVEATGFTSWYDWSIENWGTKWDVNPDGVDQLGAQDDYLDLHFNTAWSPPMPWVKALREAFPDATITAFYDEPGVQAAGYY
jgi:hypothetical protein